MLAKFWLQLVRDSGYYSAISRENLCLLSAKNYINPMTIKDLGQREALEMVKIYMRLAINILARYVTLLCLV